MTMLKKYLSALVLSSTISDVNANNINTLKLSIEKQLKGKPIDSIKTSKFSNLYEILVGGKIIYADKSGKFFFLGDIVDVSSKINITEQRRNLLNRIIFSDLPFNSAIKTVNGNGNKSIAIFSDADCKYCKNLEKELSELKNTTIYTFMYSILSDSSLKLSRDIWCATNPSVSWKEWMIQSKIPSPAQIDCISTNEVVLILGKKLNISSTPTIFFEDGSRLIGAISSNAIENKLSTIKVTSARN